MICIHSICNTVEQRVEGQLLDLISKAGADGCGVSSLDN